MAGAELSDYCIALFYSCIHVDRNEFSRLTAAGAIYPILRFANGALPVCWAS